MKKALLAAVVLATLVAPTFAQSKSRNLPPQHQEAFEKLVASLPRPDFTKSAAKSRSGIVRVSTDKGHGTGFAIANGRVIVTCSHVIRDAKNVSVQLSNNESLAAEVLVDFPHRDLAALSVPTALSPLPLATEDQFTWHTPVMVIGDGLGVHRLRSFGELAYLAKASDLFSGSRTSVLSGDTLILETTAISHPGHSGSPVFTPDGLVVGVMSNIDTRKSKVNRAIHVLHIRELLEEVIRLATEKENLAEVGFQLNEETELLDDAINDLLDSQLTEVKLSKAERQRLYRMKKFYARIESRDKRRQALAVMRSKHSRRRGAYGKGGSGTAENVKNSMLRFYLPGR